MKKHTLFGFVLIFFLASCKTMNVSKYPTIGYLESLQPEFYKLVSKQTIIEVIASGHNWTEGPVWSPKEECLIYSDVPKNIAYKWTEQEEAKPFLNPSGYSDTI